ncbi:MAG: hypothetical protein ACRCZK_01935 [Oscillospiraceae bacterium]
MRQKVKKMKNENVIIEILEHINIPEEHQADDIVAFELLKVSYIIWGRNMEDTLDTTIDRNGVRRIKDGNGFFDYGTII